MVQRRHRRRRSRGSIAEQRSLRKVAVGAHLLNALRVRCSPGRAATRVLEAYDEVPGVLAQLRANGLKLVVCSNWDWDLAEAIEESGLTDAVDLLVSSAWVGVRKSNPRIYSHTLAKAGLEPEDVLFVGDTWGADVEGPLAAGMTPMYLRRDGHWPDASCPHDEPRGRGVTVAPDLSTILSLI